MSDYIRYLRKEDRRLCLQEKHNMMICNRCHKVFKYSDAKVIYRKMYGINISEKRCPECESTFRAVELPNELDSYLYVNHDERYYSY